MTIARFIYDCSHKNADLYYATRFLTPDSMVYFECGGKKYLVLDTLEVSRAKREAHVHKIFTVSDYKKDIELRKGNPTDIVDVMGKIFSTFNIKTLEVPANFPLFLADKFRERKYKLIIGPSPFYPKRTQKTPLEKKAMIEAQKATFKLIAFVENLLRISKVKNGKLYFKGKALTSEFAREMTQIEALHLGYEMPESLIIAGGEHAIDPHDTGSGVLKPHESIIVDIFPKSQTTFFCGDATRTFCKGKAPLSLKKLYSTVKQAQELAIRSIHSKVNGRTITENTIRFFESNGYKTGKVDGRQQGFIHGVGHGIGLELHECPPYIISRDCILETGNVVSVEPGLYYKNIGGVRIEDLVYVTKTGCEVLANYPNRLEIL